MEYQLDERTRDLQEALENCQTRVRARLVKISSIKQSVCQSGCLLLPMCGRICGLIQTKLCKAIRGPL